LEPEPAWLALIWLKDEASRMGQARFASNYKLFRCGRDAAPTPVWSKWGGWRRLMGQRSSVEIVSWMRG